MTSNPQSVIEGCTYIHTHRPTNRQPDRQTERERDKQIDHYISVLTFTILGSAGSEGSAYCLFADFCSDET